MTKPNEKGNDVGADQTALPEEKISQTQHRLSIGDETFGYTATAGFMHIPNDDGKPNAALFYVAYTRDGVSDPSKRPLTFCFNGGPGSCSVWLHLGAFGPERIDMVDGDMPRPNASRLVTNDCTLLDISDLVFIDPVGTGFSCAGGEGSTEDFLSMEGDAKSFAAFIHCYLNQNHRWCSPKFLAGESYGTTRACLLSKILWEQGVALNGLVLVSLALNFQTFIFSAGNDLPYVLFLPTYAATAWHHGKLNSNIAPDLKTLLKDVRRWAIEEYGPALMRGATLDDVTRQKVAQQLSRFTGLSVEDIQRLNLRIQDMRFSKSVLNRHGYTVGRMDGRYAGQDKDADHRMTQRDPSIDAPMGAYTGIINDQLRRILAFDHKANYEVLNMKVNEDWKWTRKGCLGYPDTTNDLRETMVSNPHMKVLFANGLFDLATPFFGAEYTADHMEIEPDLRANITLTYYESGHMMYFHRASHHKLKEDLATFYQTALTHLHLPT